MKHNSPVKMKLYMVKSSTLHQLIQPGLVNIPINTSVLGLHCLQTADFTIFHRQVKLQGWVTWIEKKWIESYLWCPEHWLLWIIYGPHCGGFHWKYFLPYKESLLNLFSLCSVDCTDIGIIVEINSASLQCLWIMFETNVSIANEIPCTSIIFSEGMDITSAKIKYVFFPFIYNLYSFCDFGQLSL